MTADLVLRNQSVFRFANIEYRSHAVASGKTMTSAISLRCLRTLKLAFHETDTDTDMDILAEILARIVARMSACRSACCRNNLRKSRVSNVSARILARMSMSALASWNAIFIAAFPLNC